MCWYFQNNSCHISACLLKQPDPNYDKILEYCGKVIEVDPTNVKAYFRSGLALYNLKNYEDALHSFETAVHIDSSFSGKYYSVKIIIMCNVLIHEGVCSLYLTIQWLKPWKQPYLIISLNLSITYLVLKQCKNINIA